MVRKCEINNKYLQNLGGHHLDFILKENKLCFCLKAIRFVRRSYWGKAVYNKQRKTHKRAKGITPITWPIRVELNLSDRELVHERARARTAA